jgi:CubicO group peptidase (beta-lactamase class C family)
VLGAVELERLVGEACREANVVGASVAVASPAGVITACYGHTSVRDPVPVRPETRFRTGSMAKVHTAALLVDALLAQDRSVDERIVDLLPDFHLADGAEDELRVSHLLSHTSGINHDFWEDRFGNGDDAIARYVADLTSVATMFRPGATWAYSNSGFVLAGRLVERLVGTPYRVALEGLFRRLGLEETEVVFGPAPRGFANGHYREGEGLREAEGVEESPALLPAGTGVFASARDVAAFARELVVPASALGAAADRMRRPVVTLPAIGFDEPTHHGLGWKVYDWPKGLLVGHNGNGTGQYAWVRADVATATSLAVMVNTIPSGALVWQRVAPAFWEHVGAEPNPPVVPAATGGAVPSATASAASTACTARASRSPRLKAPFAWRCGSSTTRPSRSMRGTRARVGTRTDGGSPSSSNRSRTTSTSTTDR